MNNRGEERSRSEEIRRPRAKEHGGGRKRREESKRYQKERTTEATEISGRGGIYRAKVNSGIRGGIYIAKENCGIRGGEYRAKEDAGLKKEGEGRGWSEGSRKPRDREPR